MRNQHSRHVQARQRCLIGLGCSCCLALIVLAAIPAFGLAGSLGVDAALLPDNAYLLTTPTLFAPLMLPSTPYMRYLPAVPQPKDKIVRSPGAGSATPTHTATPTDTSTSTATNISTASATVQAHDTAEATASTTLTATPTSSVHPAHTSTATSSATNTSTRTATSTLTPSPTSTPTRTPTRTATSTPTRTPITVSGGLRNGFWGGQSSLPGGVSFSVIAGAPQTVQSFWIDLHAGACERYVSFQITQVVNNQFVYTYTRNNATITIQGTFLSATSASGSVDTRGDDGICGTDEHVTWQATWRMLYSPTPEGDVITLMLGSICFWRP